MIRVNDNKLSTDSFGLTSSQRSLSGGYEMVYSNITYGGMSGGAVLDRDGRVIGIHGLAEGETALDGQNSSVQQIQLGYSLGIPINTFVGLADRLEVNASLPIQDNLPSELNSSENKVFYNTILETEIPQGNATAEVWLERGNQLWRLQRFSEAVEAFDQAIALNLESVHLAYYGKGLALRSEKEDEAALLSLELATETKPDFTPAFSLKSSVLSNLNRLDEALVAIERAIALQKDNANLYNQQAGILSDLKRYSEAEIAYSQAIRIASYPIFYIYRGNLYEDQGKLELALTDYNRAIELEPEAFDPYVNRGFLYEDQGKLDLALADYNRIIELAPRTAITYLLRGNLYKKQGELELALADYNRAIELEPEAAKAYMNRGNLYNNQGKSELALADYNHAIEINPQFAEAYGNLGVVHIELKNTEEARFNLQKAQQLFIAQGDTARAEQVANLLQQLP